MMKRISLGARGGMQLGPAGPYGTSPRGADLLRDAVLRDAERPGADLSPGGLGRTARG
jgi:hypothetical protein